MTTFRSTIQRRRIETLFPGLKRCNLRVFQKYNPEKKDWNKNRFWLDLFRENPFRSTIQRRRIETIVKIIRFVVSDSFQKYNPEKKDWNARKIKPTCSNLCTFRSTIQRRRIETGQPLIPKIEYFTFRSTIQRRRIETWYIRRRRRIKSGFQKYNPEKKDWNKFRYNVFFHCFVLSEVQSREEGLKPYVYAYICSYVHSFRSTIQRRRIETKEIRDAFIDSGSFRSTIQRRRIETS